MATGADLASNVVQNQEQLEFAIGRTRVLRKRLVAGVRALFAHEKSVSGSVAPP